MNVPLMVATATSNFMIGVDRSRQAAIVYYRRGDILVHVAAPLAVGRLSGIAARSAHGTPASHAKYVVHLLVAIMLYLAVHLIVHLLSTGMGMSQTARNPRSTGKFALVLRIGAYGGFLIMLAGLVVGLSATAEMAFAIERVGVLVMLATPRG